jgi:hypothetical protein
MPQPSPSSDYGAPQDSTSLGTTTIDSTTLSTGSDIYSLLNSLYGQNPFGAIHTGVGGEERAYEYGPLHWLTQQIGNATDAAMFVNNIINALLAQGIDLDAVGPAGVTQLVQQMWSTPAIRQKFLLAPSPTSVQTLVRQTMGGTTAGIDYAAQVPTPFDPKIFADPNNITQKFGVNGELGNDIAMNYGTRVYAPMAGTVTLQHTDQAGWNAVWVHLDNGWSYLIGHFASMDVVDGQRVNPGDLLGLSGGLPGDSWNSTGPHIEFQVRNAQGQSVDSMPLLQQLFKGTSFAQLMLTFGSGILGAGVSAAEAKNRLLGRDPILDAKYGQVRSLWQKYYGVDPTAEQMMRVIGAGTDPAQWEDYIRGLGSHLPGITIGSYTDLRGLADAAFQKVYGNPSNDDVVKELHDKNLTTAEGVMFYVDQLPFKPGRDVPPIVYNAVYGSAAQHSQNIWNQPPHPQDLQAIWTAAGAPTELPASQLAQAAQQMRPKLSVVQGGEQRNVGQ